MHYITRLVHTQIKESRKELEDAFDYDLIKESESRKRGLNILFSEDRELYIAHLERELHYLKTGEWK